MIPYHWLWKRSRICLILTTRNSISNSNWSRARIDSWPIRSASKWGATRFSRIVIHSSVLVSRKSCSVSWISSFRARKAWMLVVLHENGSFYCPRKFLIRTMPCSCRRRTGTRFNLLRIPRLIRTIWASSNLSGDSLQKPCMTDTC